MSTDRRNKPPVHESKQPFEWKMTIRAGDVDFMATDDDKYPAGCVGDCSAISPLPPSSRRPRRRQVEGR
jgi:hypothetical protein